MNKIKHSFSCLLLTAYCLLFLSPAAASAFTYQDVQKSLNDNPAPQGCINWVEEVTTDAGKGYRVWQRCSGNQLYSTTRYASTQMTVVSGGDNVFNCGVGGLTFVPAGQSYARFYGSYNPRWWQKVISCKGITSEQDITWWVGNGTSSLCADVPTMGVNCKQYDLLLAELIPVDECFDYTGNPVPCAQNCQDPVAKAGTTIIETCGDGIDNNCNGQIDEGCGVCANGATRSCYSGREGTEGKGICKAGVQTCTNGQWGSCTGEVIPEEKEQCDGKDHNCNDQVAETCRGPFCRIPMGSTAHPGSGNLYHSQTLLQTPNSNLRTDFTLSYNSLDAFTSPLGKGWTHNYNLLLTSNPDASLGLKQGDGNVIYFRQNGGVYYPENRSGDHSTIIKNADGTFTQTTKQGIIYTFSSSGKLTQIKDKNNNDTNLTYTGDDLTTITDSTGRAINITYTNGKITSITDPANRAYVLSYAGDSLTAITDPANNTWQYTYDANGRMLTKTDPQAYTTTYTHDIDGRITQSTDPEGKTKAIAYDTANNTAIVTEKDGGVWTYKYDNILNVPLEVTDPNSNTTTYTYDANRNLLSKTDPDGTTTAYTYDDRGQHALHNRCP